MRTVKSDFISSSLYCRLSRESTKLTYIHNVSQLQRSSFSWSHNAIRFNGEEAAGGGRGAEKERESERRRRRHCYTACILSNVWSHAFSLHRLHGSILKSLSWRLGVPNLFGVLFDPIDVRWNARVHGRIFRIGAAIRPWNQSDEFSVDSERTAGITLDKNHLSTFWCLTSRDIARWYRKISTSRFVSWIKFRLTGVTDVN